MGSGVGAAPAARGPAPGAGAEPDLLESGLRTGRWIVLALLLLEVGGELAAYGGPRSTLAGPGSVVHYVISGSAVVALLWPRWPWLTVSLVALAIALSLINGVNVLDTWVVPAAMVVVALRQPARVVAVTFVGLAVVLPVTLRLVTRIVDPIYYAATISMVLLGLLAGLTVRALRVRAAQDRQRAARLREDTVRVRAQERASLADDLQAGVTARLAGVRELVAGVRLDDPAQIRGTLVTVQQEAATCLAELRGLLGLLREGRTDDSVQAAGTVGPVRRVGWQDERSLRRVAMILVGVLALLALADAGLDLAQGRPLVVLPGLVTVTILVALRHGLAGWFMAALCVGVSPLVPVNYNAWAAMAVSLLVGIAMARSNVLLLTMGLALTVVYSAVRFDGLTLFLTLVAAHVLLGALVGVCLRAVVQASSAAREQERALRQERERLEQVERSGVARELHDVVAHQLSLTAMSIMAATVSDDPDVAAATLERVREHAAAAEAELLHTLRGEVEPGAPDPWTSVPGRVGHLQKHLQDSSFEVEVEVDAHAADALDPLTRRTVIRVLQEGTTNAVRYAPSRSRVTLSVEVTPEGVVVGVASALASERGRSTLSLGYGLRGLAERVDLTGGEFSAGPVGDQWQVRAVLPVVAEVSASPAPAPRPAPAR